MFNFPVAGKDPTGLKPVVPCYGSKPDNLSSGPSASFIFPGTADRKNTGFRIEKYSCTSIIVACELRYGAAKRQSPKLTFNVEQDLASLPVLPFQDSADATYAIIRAHLEQRGLPIGCHDLLIAAHASSLDLIVVTANEREFSRIPDLKVENWSYNPLNIRKVPILTIFFVNLSGTTIYIHTKRQK